MKIAIVLAAATIALGASPAAAVPYEGAWGAAQEVLYRALGEEGLGAVREGESAAYEAAGLVDLEEENTEENFRCRFSRLIGSEVKCLTSSP